MCIIYKWCFKNIWSGFNGYVVDVDSDGQPVSVYLMWTHRAVKHAVKNKGADFATVNFDASTEKI